MGCRASVFANTSSSLKPLVSGRVGNPLALLRTKGRPHSLRPIGFGPGGLPKSLAQNGQSAYPKSASRPSGNDYLRLAMAPPPTDERDWVALTIEDLEERWADLGSPAT